MIVALVIIWNVILCYYLSSNEDSRVKKSSLLSYAILFSLFLFLIQMILGTEVRESVDTFLKIFGFGNRSQIIESLGSNFIIHRSFSLVILALQLFITFLVYKKSEVETFYKKVSIVMLSLICFEILVGAGMAYFQIPKILQPIHLILAFLIFGIQFYIMLINLKIKKIETL